jgi:hypothetical protein
VDDSGPLGSSRELSSDDGSKVAEPERQTVTHVILLLPGASAIAHSTRHPQVALSLLIGLSEAIRGIPTTPGKRLRGDSENSLGQSIIVSRL